MKRHTLSVLTAIGLIGIASSALAQGTRPELNPNAPVRPELNPNAPLRTETPPGQPALNPNAPLRADAPAGQPALNPNAPLRADAMAQHPWREWADQAGDPSRMPGGQSRWSAGKDLSWEPLRIERVCEVKYDHLQGDRFRHATIFLRWRPDKRPEDCRYDQLEVTTPYELAKVFGAQL